MTRHDHHIGTALRREFGDWRLWWSRALVMSFAAAAGLTVVGFTWLTEQALARFSDWQQSWPLLPLIWTPACTAAIVWLTRRHAPGAAGSGIPQVMAALDPAVGAAQRGLFVSLRLAVAKVSLTAWGLLAGLSVQLALPDPPVRPAQPVPPARRRRPRRRSAASWARRSSAARC
jgi:H+/Cl- antiporter ClcA